MTEVMLFTTNEYDYELVIPGDPKAQGRPRTRVVQSKLYLRELIRNIKTRIAFIGHPKEPMNEAGPDWSEEIRQMDTVLAAGEKKAFPVIYEDKKDKENKAKLAAQVRHLAPKKLLDCALRVDIHFYFPRPDKHYGTGRNAGVLKATAPTHYISKSDRDNLDKLVLDALTGVFWKDDSRVCCGWLQKEYSDNPRTEIFIKILE